MQVDEAVKGYWGKENIEATQAKDSGCGKTEAPLIRGGFPVRVLGMQNSRP